MILNEDLLLAHGAQCQYYDVNQTIFVEGSNPKYYFQIMDGIVELNNYHFDGKEFVQNIFSAGQSLGESLLFLNRPYPMNAIAKTKCSILKIPKKNFFNILSLHPEVSLVIFKCISDRLYKKYKISFGLSSSDPVFKITTLLNDLKDSGSDNEKFSSPVPLTRQQLANLTGLRVETVIRAVKKMEREDQLKIDNGKIYY